MQNSKQSRIDWHLFLSRLYKRYGILLSYAIILTFALLAAIPIVWMFLTSIRPMEDIYAIPIKYIPSHFLGLEQYFKVFEDRPYFLYTLNSLIISGVTTLLCLALGTPAGYGLARGGFRLANYVLLGMLSFRLFPPIALLPAFYLIFYKLGILDTLTALIVANTYFNLPIAIFLLRGFFRDIPTDFEEAARIDGCSRLGAFYRVILKLAGPGIAAAAIMVFLFTWNEFVFAITLAGSSPESTVLAVGITHFIGDTFIAWNFISAAGVVTGLPALVFVLFFQKYIISGLIAGSLKE
ncbi:MAG: carbohydrate ABC transporter permease [Nitrospinota bacterium]|nr:MAG: carbohydrate ABC transporter permease [Nitrospinota bacterium]